MKSLQNFHVNINPIHRLNPTMLHVHVHVHTARAQSSAYTVEPLTTDSPYYGNLHNADKRQQSQDKTGGWADKP